MKYDLLKPWKTLDPWQKEVLQETSNLCLRSGRQVGKSTVISIKAGEWALANPNQTIMIIASVERQALLLFEKVLSYIHAKNKKEIRTGKERPTKHKLTLKNGSKILCLPTGETGYGIRGFTINLLIADEAAFIPEEVWAAVTPMLAVTKGKIILLSTPFGRLGYFYRCFDDATFKGFHVSSEDCLRIDKEFLSQEAKRMSKLQYAQEYLGEFVDELRQFFPDHLIRQCMKGKRTGVEQDKQYYLGVDIARMGRDESTFQVIDRSNRKMLVHVENLVTRKTLTTETTNTILALNKRYNFKQIFIDDGGMGVGVFDQLLTNDETHRKVIAINNTSRPLQRFKKKPQKNIIDLEIKRKKALKEDIFNNLLSLMEKGEIILLDDEEVFLSLKSVQFEYLVGGKFRIFGKDIHIADGLVRAAWCSKDKSLNIYIY